MLVFWQLLFLIMTFQKFFRPLHANPKLFSYPLQWPNRCAFAEKLFQIIKIPIKKISFPYSGECQDDIPLLCTQKNPDLKKSRFWYEYSLRETRIGVLLNYLYITTLTSATFSPYRLYDVPRTNDGNYHNHRSRNNPSFANKIRAHFSADGLI